MMKWTLSSLCSSSSFLPLSPPLSFLFKSISFTVPPFSLPPASPCSRLLFLWPSCLSHLCFCICPSLSLLSAFCFSFLPHQSSSCLWEYGRQNKKADRWKGGRQTDSSTSLWIHRNPLTVKIGKLAWFGHVTCQDSLSKTFLLGTLEGGRRCGRQRECWMDNIKEWTSSCPNQYCSQYLHAEKTERESLMNESSFMSSRQPNRLKGLNWTLPPALFPPLLSFPPALPPRLSYCL